MSSFMNHSISLERSMVRMRNTIFTYIRVDPQICSVRNDIRETNDKMVGFILKLAVFITLSLHYVIAQGTSKQ